MIFKRRIQAVDTHSCIPMRIIVGGAGIPPELR
jgi:hypothetical protein